MRVPLVLTFASLLLSPLASSAGQTAQARMYCISVRLNQGTDAFGDTLTVNSTGTPGGAGEMIPWGQAPQREYDPYATFLYTSVATLYDSTYDSTFVDGTFTVNLPELVDLNTNGYPDFFEVSQGVDTNAYNSSYHFGFPVGNGAIWTTWLRAAGSSSGTCTLYWPDYQSSFSHPFQILEYTGSLSYTPGSNSVAATVNLKQTGAATNTLAGSLTFTKSLNDRMNTLNLQYGNLSDASQQRHWFTNHVFYRNLTWPTNYSGYVEFDDDGTQNTAYSYAFWVLSITDTNDVNRNGIPDFSDDPQVVPPSGPRPPQIALAQTSTNLLMQISGDIGYTHTVQTASSLPGVWQDVLSVTLTNSPQTIPLPPGPAPSYWRVFAK